MYTGQFSNIAKTALFGYRYRMGLFNGLLGPQDAVINDTPNTPSSPSPNDMSNNPSSEVTAVGSTPLPVPTPPKAPEKEETVNVDSNEFADTKLVQLDGNPIPGTEGKTTDASVPPSTPPDETKTAPPPVAPSPLPSADAGMSMQDLQNQLDVINSFKKNPSVEALVALMYHKEDYMAALKNNALDELLSNIRKYNPLVKAFNESSK